MHYYGIMGIQEDIRHGEMEKKPIIEF